MLVEPKLSYFLVESEAMEWIQCLCWIENFTYNVASTRETLLKGFLLIVFLAVAAFEALTGLYLEMGQVNNSFGSEFYQHM